MENTDAKFCTAVSSRQSFSSGYFTSMNCSFDSKYNVTESIPTNCKIETIWSTPSLKQYYETSILTETTSLQGKTKHHFNSAFNFLPRQQKGEAIMFNERNHIVEKATIWRPFTPEPESKSLFSNTEMSTVNTKQDHGKHKVFNKIYFPTITPSNVKLGSAKSVFKAVKKKKYQCQYCSMNYFNNGQLTGHIRAHIGLRPYRCEFPQCSRAFARNEELTRHKRIHSGYKPHQCNICKKQFGRKDHLNKHSKTHLKTSEKKIYLCQIPGCGHKYTRSDALTRHHTMAHSNRSCKLH